MQTSYIYSVSRTNALSEDLLSLTDIERLLVATPGEDLHQALKETYLASFVTHVPEENMALAIEQTLIDAKRLIHRIAPHGDMFRILWVQYDIHNLRVFVKAAARNLPFEDCVPFLSKRGIYDPEYLYRQVESKSLDSLQKGWQAAYQKALEFATAGQVDKVDAVFDELHFATGRQIVAGVGDRFMQQYFARAIDVFNLKSQSRALMNPGLALTPAFIPGGTFGSEHITSVEDVRPVFARLAPAAFWEEALEFFETTGNTSRLDARIDEAMIMFAKEGSYDMFSSASLVLYYLRCRQAAANIRTIVVGKDSGMKEEDIRANLRLVYVND